MTDDYRSPGKTTLAPEVLLTITRMSALSVEGVSRLAHVASGVDSIFKKSTDNGVRMHLEGDIVYVELYLILKSDCNVREVSRKVQAQVARAISEMVGMEVGHVNVHIEDIAYPNE